MARLRDIKKFTSNGHWESNMGWDYFFEWIQKYEKDFKENFQLDPDFQRAHVWNEEKQIKYIEFILKGGQSSRNISFNCVGWMINFKGPMVLVDGKQRIEAVRKFMFNELPIFGGHYFRDYSDTEILPQEAHFLVRVNDLKTRKEVLQWYIDLNEGGVVHTQDELDKVRNYVLDVYPSENKSFLLKIISLNDEKFDAGKKLYFTELVNALLELNFYTEIDENYIKNIYESKNEK